MDSAVHPFKIDIHTHILPKTWPYSLSDPDLWSDVPPPRPYAAAAARGVEQTSLPWVT